MKRPETKEEAEAQAQKWADHMGEPWFTHVWSNGGWCWDIRIEVDGDRCVYMVQDRSTGDWTCFFNSITQTLGKAATPERALSQAIQKAEIISLGLAKDIEIVRWSSI